MTASAKPQIIAIGGAALPPELDNLLLIEYFLRQTRKRNAKVCFVGTAGGDAEPGRLRFYAGFSQFTCRPTHLPLFARTPRDLESFILEQDAIFVGGGNTRSMHGIVLGGVSAGAICWFAQGVTDSVAGRLTVLDCLGFLGGSCCPHYDSEPQRRPTFKKLIARGALIDGIAADDGVALHYVGDKLLRSVGCRPRARAYRVRRSVRHAVETRLPTRYLRGD